MTSRVTTRASRKIARDVNDAAADIRTVATRASRRLGDDAKDVAQEFGDRARVAARGFAVRAGKQSSVVARRAMREAKARPVAAIAIIAAAAAVIGAFIAGSSRRA